MLAQLLFGGITPLVNARLIAAAGNPPAPGLYLTAVTLLSLCCLFAARRLAMPEAECQPA